MNYIMLESLVNSFFQFLHLLIELEADMSYFLNATFTTAAAHMGDLNMLQELHKRGANIHEANIRDVNCIMSASLGTGDCETVRWLIEQGVDVNYCNKNKYTAAHCAAQEGYLDILKLLHMNGGNIHQLTSNGVNCIMLSSGGTGDCDTVSWLIAQGVDVNHSDNDLFTAVHYAAHKGKLAVLKLLHANGGNFHHVAHHGYNCIMLASLGTGDCETVSWLIEQGLDVNYCDKDFFTAIHCAAQKGKLDLLKLLHTNGANIHQVSRNGTNSLMSASLGIGDCETVSWLIKHGVDVNFCNQKKYRAVHGAAQEGNLDVLKLLHKNGGNIHQLTSNGFNCIMLASEGNGDCETVSWLISQGVDVNHCDNYLFTAVHYAAFNGKLDLLKLLHRNGAKIDQVDRDGKSPIITASLGTGDCDTVEWLIKQGVDVNNSNKDGLTAVHCAAEKNNLHLLKLLHKHGANIHQVGSVSTSPIMSALQPPGGCKIVRWLIEQGVDINYCGEDHLTAAHVAANFGNLDVLKLLHKHGANIQLVRSDGFNCIMSTSDGTGDRDTMSWLIEQGLDVNCCGEDHITAAHCAAHKGNLDVLKLLHKHGANIFQVRSNGFNCIMSASLGTGDCHTVAWLIGQGLDVNYCNREYLCAVDCAAHRGNLHTIKLLKKHGANIYGTNAFKAVLLGSNDYDTMNWLIEQGVDMNCCDKENFSAVHYAARDGNLDMLKLFHMNGANIHQVTDDGMNCTMLAIIGTGDCKTVSWLVEQGVDVNYCDNTGFTVVHCAAQRGNLAALKILHDNGANIHEVMNNGLNSIMLALLGTRNFEIVSWLIKQGVDVNCCQKDDSTAIHFAAEEGCLDILKLLHKHGANIHQVTNEGTNPIMAATLGTGDCDSVSWLIEQGADINHCDQNNCTAVHFSAVSGKLDLLKLLQKNGGNIYQVVSNGNNALISATLGTGDYDTVNWLIKQGVDINQSNKQNCTAVHYSARAGHLDVLKLLQENGADIHQVTQSGINSIISALRKTANCDTVSWLIEQGVDKYHCTKTGCTAIHYAARNNNIDLLKLLKDNKFDLTALDNQGNTALHWNMFSETKEGNEMNVQWLIKEGLDVNHSNIHGACALHFAAYFGKLAVVKMLCSMGADINALDKQNKNALQFAALGKNTLETIQWLTENEINVLNLSYEGKSVLHYAAEHGQTDILEYIVVHDQRVSHQSDDG